MARAEDGSLIDVSLARELFWHNVVREFLTEMSVLAASNPELFDGRTAVLTRDGSRIPIAGVAPVFACSIIGGSDLERAASIAVECTIFRIRTPQGEVFTLPVHEIRAFHTLTDELIKKMEQIALKRQSRASGRDRGPFGFAEFVARKRRAELAVHEGAD